MLKYKQREFHGGTGTHEYRVWKEMRRRCLRPLSDHYHRYGARGITICERWNNFSAFLADMGCRPYDGATLERIDNERGYSPENYKWASHAEQNDNRRNTVFLTFLGRTRPLVRWANDLGLNTSTVRYRLSLGWTVDDALSYLGDARRKERRSGNA